MYFSLDVSAVMVDVVYAARIGTPAKYWFGADMAFFHARNRTIGCLKAIPEMKCRLTCAAKMVM